MSLTSLIVPNSLGQCPAGFGPDGFFPPEWAIPTWPQDMPVEIAAELRTVTLDGFEVNSLNEEYLEGPTPDFQVQGRETYWSSSGKYFLFYCRAFEKWRVADLSGFGQNKADKCLAFVSDTTAGREILNASLIKGFMEVEDDEWVFREDAGVAEVGKLGDQMELEEATSAEADAHCSSPEGKRSDCPVMPAVRKAKAHVVEAARAASKWMRRLFPKKLGAPDEEDAIPEVPSALFQQPIEIGDTVVLTSGEDQMRQSFSSTGFAWDDAMVAMLGQTRKVVNAKNNGNIFAVEEDEVNHNRRFWYFSRKAASQIIKQTKAGLSEAESYSQNCDPRTQQGCNFKEKFYIDRQTKATVQERKAELTRLMKLKDVVMKPEQKNWLKARVSILQKMTGSITKNSERSAEL